MKGNTLPEADNKVANYEARITSERNEPLVAALIPTAVSTKQPVKYQLSDYKWINENKGKLLENGWGQLATGELIIPEKLMRHYVSL